MAFRTEIAPVDTYTAVAAAQIAQNLSRISSLVLTGGATAERIYPRLAAADGDWSSVTVFFSDERCVPPSDARSNFGMASRLLLDRVGATNVVRMRGEDQPEEAARAYSRAVEDAVGKGFDLLLLGLGGDCHICALFPGSAALEEKDELCVAVERPDGLRGLTLTPPAVVSARKVLLVVSGFGKAEAVQRVIQGGESPDSCPARLLVDHPDVTFLLDEPAASLL